MAKLYNQLSWSRDAGNSFAKHYVGIGIKIVVSFIMNEQELKMVSALFELVDMDYNAN